MLRTHKGKGQGKIIGSEEKLSDRKIIKIARRTGIPLEIKTPLIDFGEEMQCFYISPTQKKFEKLKEKATKFEKKLRKTNNNADLLASMEFARISEKYGWKILDKSRIGKRAKEILEGNTDTAKFILDDDEFDLLLKFDLWWASFFATGEEVYLDKIFHYANCPAEGEFLDDNIKKLFSTAAVWSFECNCNQHDAIKNYVSKSLKTEYYFQIKEDVRKQMKP